MEDPLIQLEFSEWVVVEGELCHSSRQIASGEDLRDLRKKYKRMHCAWCAQYNPSTPWARCRTRRLERATLSEHASSSHHEKAAVLRQAALLHCARPIAFPDDFSEDTTRSEPQESAASELSITADTVPLIMVYPQHTADSVLPPHSEESPFPSTPLIVGDDGGDSNQYDDADVDILDFALPEFELLSPIAFPLSLSQSSAVETPPPSLEEEKSFSSPQTLPRKKVQVAPLWVRCNGPLCHSEQQRSSGKDLSAVKRKYKMLQCSYCAQFIPSAPWAKMKPRKFEISVFQEHERSSLHRRAMALLQREQPTDN